MWSKLAKSHMITCAWNSIYILYVQRNNSALRKYNLCITECVSCAYKWYWKQLVDYHIPHLWKGFHIDKMQRSIFHMIGKYYYIPNRARGLETHYTLSCVLPLFFLEYWIRLPPHGIYNRGILMRRMIFSTRMWFGIQ